MIQPSDGTVYAADLIRQGGTDHIEGIRLNYAQLSVLVRSTAQLIEGLLGTSVLD